MPLPAPPGYGIMPSLLGRYWVDCEFILQGAGLIVVPPTTNLALQPLTWMLMADTTQVTADDIQDLVDADPSQLAAPYVVTQIPYPNVAVAPGATVQIGSAQIGIGYSVPTSIGPIPVP